MAETLNFEPFIRSWIVARCPDLEGRVYPCQAVQDDRSPYCVYTPIAETRYSNQDGPEGMTRLMIRFDVWATSRSVAKSQADLICGKRDNPGLDGYRGALVADGFAGDAWVQRCNLDDTGFEDYEKPKQGQTQGWHRVARDFTFYFDEDLK